MPVTLETIARRLKVSKVTVSLGLRGSRRISEALRAKIVKVVVTTHVPLLSWLARSGLRVPRDIACVHLDWTPKRGDFAGMNQQPEQVGAAAIDLLVEQINQNRHGVPEVPKSVLIEGLRRKQTRRASPLRRGGIVAERRSRFAGLR